MRKSLLSLILALAGLHLFAQKTVRIDLESATNPNRLELYATATNFGPTDVLSSVRVTVSWPSACNVTDLGVVTTSDGTLPFSKLIPGGAANGADRVQILAGFNAGGGMALTNGVKTRLMTVPVSGSGGTPTCAFTIIDGYTHPDPMIGSGSFYAEINTFVNITTAPTAFFSSANLILPVELLSFKGSKKGSKSQLQWETVNEKNLVNYIIERSADGRNFHPVGFTKPKSTSALEKVTYEFTDDQPDMGINYYRLLSKGLGKDEKYSKVISLDFGLGLSGRAFPNPLDGDLSVELDIESNSGTVEASIYDVVGKQVLSRKIQNSDRRINLTLPTNDLPPGSYIVKVKVGTFNWERQITKM
jgi:hypothetical protein